MRSLIGLVLLLVAGCTVAVPGTAQREPSAVPISASRGGTVAAGPQLMISVPDGAVDVDTTLAAVPSSVALPERPGFVNAGRPFDVTVGAALRKPVALTFAGEGGPEGAMPVVLRHDADLGWYPVEVGEPGQPLVAQRMELSTYLPGWFVASAGWVRDRLVGKSDPAQCGAKPDWAQFTAPKIDVVTGCIGADGAVAALSVRSNRAVPLQVAVPAGDVPAVKGRSEPLHGLLTRLAGKDRVILFEGEELTLRWQRPAQSATRTVVPHFTVATSVARAASVLFDVKDYRSAVGLLVFVHGCREVVDARDVAAGLDALQKCASPLMTESGSRTAALAILAQVTGLSEDVIASDKNFQSNVLQLKSLLRVAGKVFKFYTGLKLAAELAQAVQDGSATETDRAVVVRLNGTEPPPLEAAFVGTWSQHAGGLEIRATRTGRISYQVQSAAPANFYEMDLKLEQAGPGTVKATATTSNDPEKPKGTVLTLRLQHPGIVITGMRHGNTQWCNATTRANGLCGA
ncbi:hypothetical protein [Lentzea albida]|uniref:Uncharacterized protein n=1 Tax=Lentzea albida TaxID=65499 RepID=A0A1H9E1X3_9PSEU|nr:hypothetical protein [Lentzea albida]SEQ19736.1 hypothetical protein SAMN04488000_102134 [Lentzea albida]